MAGIPVTRDTLLDQAETIPWEEGKNVIVNGKSATWGDAFIVRETSSTPADKLLIIHQDKYEYNSAEFVTQDLYAERIKNLTGSVNTTGELRQTLASRRHITVIFTTQPFNGKVIRDRCLDISKDNFKAYFGPVFAPHANFALTTLNPNFSELARMKACLPQVGAVAAEQIKANRPFSSEEDFKKFPQVRRGIEDYETKNSGKKFKLDFYPFVEYGQTRSLW
ncbi:hypothetical protein BGX26_001073 [Mortierella sp. AD094]|nr:hypothetical protein BGX26_001073 [Mortierella sp. AD094]